MTVVSAHLTDAAGTLIKRAPFLNTDEARRGVSAIAARFGAYADLYIASTCGLPAGGWLPSSERLM